MLIRSSAQTYFVIFLEIQLNIRNLKLLKKKKKTTIGAFPLEQPIKVHLVGASISNMN